MKFKRKAPRRSEKILLRMTPQFRVGLLLAASKAKAPNVCAFVRQCIVAHAREYKVEVKTQSEE